MFRSRLTRILLLAFLLVVFILPASYALITDWWWFREIGYQVVFTRELTTRVLLFLAAGGLTAGVLYLNLRAAQRGLVPNPVVLRIAPTAPHLNLTAALRGLSLPVAIVLGLLAGLAATSAWDVVLRAIYGTPFGIADPIFSRDIGFYVFTLPALSAAIGFLTTLSRLCLFLLVPLYWMRGDVVLRTAAALSIEPAAGLHLAILLAVLFLLTALRLWLVEIPESALFDHRSAGRRQLHRPACRAARAPGVGGTRDGGGGRRADRGPEAAARPVRRAGDRRLRDRGRPRPRPLPAGDAEAPRGADRADSRDALSPVPHPRHPPGLGDRQRGDPRAQRRGRSHAGRHPGQRGDHRQRAAVGPGPPAPDLRTAAGDPHLLRLHQRGRRPVLDRREVPAGPALAARAQRGVAPDPDLHQRAPDVHPRHGTHARPRQPGHQRRPARAVRQRPAAGVDRVSPGHPAADLLRRAGQRVRVRADAAAGVRPSGGRDQRVRGVHRNGRRPGRATCSAGS